MKVKKITLYSLKIDHKKLLIHTSSALICAFEEKAEFACPCCLASATESSSVSALLLNGKS